MTLGDDPLSVLDTLDSLLDKSLIHKKKGEEEEPAC